MPEVRIRVKAGVNSPGDVIASVQDNTFDYLMTSPAETMRISTYLEKDQARVEASYAELFVADDCMFESMIEKVIPGSRARGKLALPCDMKSGEQLTLMVKRAPRLA